MWSKLLHVLWYVGNIVIHYVFNKGLDQVKIRRIGSSDNEPIPVPDIYGLQLLNTLMAENDLRRRDLADIFSSDAECFSVLSGQKSLTVDHIQKMSEHFNISPLVFFPEQGSPYKLVEVRKIYGSRAR